MKHVIFQLFIACLVCIPYSPLFAANLPDSEEEGISRHSQHAHAKFLPATMTHESYVSDINNYQQIIKALETKAFLLTKQNTIILQRSATLLQDKEKDTITIHTRTAELKKSKETIANLEHLLLHAIPLNSHKEYVHRQLIALRATNKEQEKTIQQLQLRENALESKNAFLNMRINNILEAARQKKEEESLQKDAPTPPAPLQYTAFSSDQYATTIPLSTEEIQGRIREASQN
ncbi:MAG: hypothetical protein WCE21_01775 [Candidatus Babeliales bacterium]